MQNLSCFLCSTFCIILLHPSPTLMQRHGLTKGAKCATWVHGLLQILLHTRHSRCDASNDQWGITRGRMQVWSFYPRFIRVNFQILYFILYSHRRILQFIWFSPHPWLSSVDHQSVRPLVRRVIKGIEWDYCTYDDVMLWDSVRLMDKSMTIFSLFTSHSDDWSSWSFEIKCCCFFPTSLKQLHRPGRSIESVLLWKTAGKLRTPRGVSCHIGYIWLLAGSAKLPLISKIGLNDSKNANQINYWK